MAQLYNEQFLPAELQAQIGALRAAGVADRLIAPMITTILAQMEAKTTKVQLDVWRIEESLGERMERASNKIESDLRTQLGETNGMLSELLSGQQKQEAATGALRAEFQVFGETVSERLTGVEQRMDASESDRAALHTQGDQHGRQLQQVLTRLAAIEALLEVAGTREAGS